MTNDYVLDEREGWLPHLQTLHRQFYEQADDRCLLWVNPAQSDPFADDPLVDERRVRVPIQHPNFDVRFAPYLVPLDLGRSADADVFKRSVARAWNDWELQNLEAFNGQAIGGWIACDQSIQSLVQHWAVNCHIHRIGDFTKLLRFHDPGVREWLWPTLTPLQQRQMLGPAAAVTAFNRRQLLMRHAMAPSSEGSRNTEAEWNGDEPSKLWLTHTQWAQIDDYAVVHQAWLRQRVSASGNDWNSVIHGTWEQPVLSALQAATRYGICEAQDREIFAWHALQLGAEFIEHEKMQSVWRKTAAGEYYGAACEEVSSGPVEKLWCYLHGK